MRISGIHLRRSLVSLLDLLANLTSPAELRNRQIAHFTLHRLPHFF
jgi:hypothetical protein